MKKDLKTIDWLISEQFTPYPLAIDAMEKRVESIIADTLPELIHFLEHEPCYTSGTSSKAEDLLNARFPVYQTGRGGQYTYHGPGQRVVYGMLNLKNRQQEPDLKAYVSTIENWIIKTLAEFNLTGFTAEGRTGVWLKSRHSPSGEAKIAAIGIRVRKWVAYHGFSINIDPDMSHFDGIVPCGIKEHGVTSLIKEGIIAGMDEMDAALKKTCPFI